MTNISITSKCNRTCAFCFAPEPAVQHASAHMSLEMFDQALNLVIRSGMREVRLLGGEPTLHPDFEVMVQRVTDRGLCLLVFSGGMIPESAQRALEPLPADRLRILLNVPTGDERDPAVDRRQRRLFQRFGARVMLGVTIDGPGVSLEFLMDLIASYGLHPAVRLGLAHPRLDRANRFLHPRHYPEVGARIAAFALAARERRIDVDLDCGFVPCMFPAGTLDALGKGPNEVGLRCGPILDVLTDGSVISCYPLADEHREELPENGTAALLRQRFEEHLKSYRPLMLYKACESCDFRMRGECRGGCLSASMGRLRRVDFAISPSVRRLPVVGEAART